MAIICRSHMQHIFDSCGFFHLAASTCKCSLCARNELAVFEHTRPIRYTSTLSNRNYLKYISKSMLAMCRGAKSQKRTAALDDVNRCRMRRVFSCCLNVLNDRLLSRRACDKLCSKKTNSAVLLTSNAAFQTARKSEFPSSFFRVPSSERSSELGSRNSEIY